MKPIHRINILLYGVGVNVKDTPTEPRDRGMWFTRMTHSFAPTVPTCEWSSCREKNDGTVTEWDVSVWEGRLATRHPTQNSPNPHPSQLAPDSKFPIGLQGLAI